MTGLRYENITPGIFLDRPNRFIAHVEPGELKILPGFRFFGQADQALGGVLPGQHIVISFHELNAYAGPGLLKQRQYLRDQDPAAGKAGPDPENPFLVLRDISEFLYHRNTVPLEIPGVGQKHLSRVGKLQRDRSRKQGGAKLLFQ